MQLSVIVSTYNSPLWLEKVLWGYNQQSYREFELIIADDGSRAETAALIQQMRDQTSLDIKHIWQTDKGFRKCRILNKAILNAAGSYLVFTDGDCIPRRDFLAVHARKARPGHYLSGGYYKLPMATSEAIGKKEILSGECFDIKWLYAHGLAKSYKNLKLIADYKLAGVLNTITPTRCNFKGSNGSAWREDVFRVNGFDERMTWGSEDREFGVRLQNAGIKPRHVRYDAIVIHLDHARSYSNEQEVKNNKMIRQQSERLGTTMTSHGLQQLIEAGYEPAKVE